MAKTKKLTLSTLNKHDAQLNEKRTIHIIDNQYTCTIDLKFRRTKIQKLLIDYFAFVQELKSQPNVTDETVLKMPILLYALICKYFSDLPVQFDNIDELVDVTKKLLDLGIIEQLFNGGENGFVQSEIELLNKEIAKASKGIGEAFGEMAYMSALSETIEGEGVEDELQQPE